MCGGRAGASGGPAGTSYRVPEGTVGWDTGRGTVGGGTGSGFRRVRPRASLRIAGTLAAGTLAGAAGGPVTAGASTLSGCCGSPSGSPSGNPFGSSSAEAGTVWEETGPKSVSKFEAISFLTP